MITKILHTAISTTDINRALKFYCDVLGFKQIASTRWEQGNKEIDRLVGLHNSASQAIMLELNGTGLELFEYSSPTPANVAQHNASDIGFTHICLGVDNIEEEYERLVASGMMFHCPPQDFGTIKATYGRDPDGNIIELYESNRGAGSEIGW